VGQFTQNGVVYEELPNGQVRVVGYAPMAGATPLGGPDPKLPYEVQQAQGQAAASRFAAPKAQADTTIAQANAANAQAVAEAQARKAEAEARIAEMNARNGKSQLDPKVRADAIAGYNTAQQLRAIADSLGPSFAAGPGATSGVEGVLDYLPLTTNQQFDTAGNKARGIVGQALGFTGGQLNTEREAERSVGPYIPQSSDRDAKALDKIQSLQDLADTAESRAIAILGGVPDANGNITPVAPKGEQADKTNPLIANGAPASAQIAPATTVRDVVDPVMKGIGLRAGKMLASGASEATVLDFFKKSGANADIPRIRQIIQWRGSKEGRAWMRANPGTPVPVDPSFYTKQVPMSMGRQIGNAAAQSAPGAYFMNAAQGVTGNHLDELVSAAGGNGEAVNTGIQMSRASSPNASFIGDLSGQAMAQYLMGRVPGLRALPNSSLGRAGEDALYGAYAGHGEGDTAGGAISNAIGGKLGRGLGALGGVAANGVRGSASLRYLNDAGVPLTIGQIGRGTEAAAGNLVGGLEERAAGLPIFDAIIGSARKRGDEGFNRAAFREMGGSGATGSAGIAEGKGLVNKAYSFLDNANLPLDAQFAGSQAAVRAGLPGLPAFGPEIARSLDTINLSAKGGSLPGRDWQSALRATKANRSSISGQPFSDGATGALGDVENNLLGLAQRQGPPGTLDNLSSANALNSRFQTLASALDNGPAQVKDELFSPTRLDTAARASARNYGGRVNSMAGNRPFYDLTQAGMDAMPNLTPDSGTAGRALFYSALPAILGGSAGGIMGGMSDNGGVGEGAAQGTGFGTTLIPTLALATLYSKGGQRGLQKALLGQRPKALESAVQSLASNPITRRLLNRQMAGMFGSAVSRDVYMYPELEQPVQ
jgi:hypothetical protein